MILMSCNNVVLASTLILLRRILKLIWIIAPILLIMSLSINITLLVKDPDDKKVPKKIKNSILALFFVFFIPTIVNAFMVMLSDSNSFTACWNVDINPVSSNSRYVDPYPRGRGRIGTNPSDYENGERRSDSAGDVNVTSCGNLEYCNKFLSIMYNNSRKLNDAVNKNHAKVVYNGSTGPKSWSEVLRIAESGGTVNINCVRVSQWGMRDITGKYVNFYSGQPGGFKHYEGPMKNYTTQLTFNGSKSVKTAIQEGNIKPGDIIGTSGHTFAIYSVDRKNGSALVFDGGHRFTNKCQIKGSCAPLVTYSPSSNAHYKLYQIIRWVK